MEVREPNAKYLAVADWKQTDLGLVPRDWDIQTIGELCSISAGRDLMKSDFSPVQSNKHPHPIYSNAIGGRGLYGYSSKPQYDGDSITVTARGDVGHAFYRESAFSAIGRLLVLRSKRECDLRYVCEYINTKVAFSVESTGVPQLTAPQISSYNIALPLRPVEQQAIATALSDADSLIESLEQLLTKKRQIKQGAMQELLTGKRRLPGFQGDWTLGSLGDVVHGLIAGVSVNSDEDLLSADAYVLKTSALSDGQFLPHQCKPIARSDWARARTNPRADSILISRMNTPDLVGEVGYVPKDFPSLFLPDRLWMTQFRSDVQVNTRWLCQLLNSTAYKRRIRNSATGTSGSMKNISKDSLLSLPIQFPEFQEQTAIASMVADMDTEIASVETKLTKARQIKQGMMQELLTGRIRLT